MFTLLTFLSVVFIFILEISKLVFLRMNNLSFIIVYLPIFFDVVNVSFHLAFCNLRIFKVFYLFLERRRKGGRGGETSMCGCLSSSPTGDSAHNPGLSCDWESNLRPFGCRPALNSLSHTSQGYNFRVLKSASVPNLYKYLEIGVL